MVSLDSKPSPITTETKNRKNRILNNVNQLYNKYFDTYKKKNDSENLNVLTWSLISSKLSNSTFSKLANSAVLGVFGTQCRNFHYCTTSLT